MVLDSWSSLVKPFWRRGTLGHAYKGFGGKLYHESSGRLSENTAMATYHAEKLLRCCGYYTGLLKISLGKPWNQKSEKIKYCRSLHVDSPPCVPSLTTSYVHGTSTVSLLPLTVGEALQTTAAKWPHRDAVVFLQDNIRKTFSQFQQDVDQLAAGLVALGLKKGDRLGLWCPNIYEWILFQFATAKAAIILVSLNPAYQLTELEFAPRKVQCNAVVCPTQSKSQRFCDILRKICPELNTAVSGII